MMGALSVLSWPLLSLLAFCVLAETCQQLCFKAGSNRAAAGEAGVLRGAMLQPLIWTGVVIWIIEALAWVLVLRQAPLSVAYPVMTLTYVGVPLGGALLLGERMSRLQVAGAALIAIGVLCVALSGGDA